jgi:hypothetical protein
MSETNPLAGSITVLCPYCSDPRPEDAFHVCDKEECQKRHKQGLSVREALRKDKPAWKNVK